MKGIKRMILGCTLLLSGILGFTIWVTGCYAVTAYSSPFTSLSFVEWIVAVIFIILAVAGAYISIKECRTLND